MAINKVGIIGSGLMGTGIAFVTARQLETEVVVVDVADKFLQKSRASMEAMASRAVEKGQATREQAATWVQRVRFSLDKKDVAGAAIVIEAVPEDLALKCKTFAELDELCSGDTMLATNTTGLPVTQIAAATKRPDRVIGTHFFNPAAVMKLVELVRGCATSDAMVAKAQQFCASLGKETIVVQKDFPGFVTTRILNGYFLEALHCLEEGVASAEDIDKGCKLAYNHPMGPFELMDLVGLETVLAVSQDLYSSFGERCRPSVLLRQMVNAGRLGRKAGQGFYSYAAKGKNA